MSPKPLKQEKPDPALELTDRLWEAHKDYEKRERKRVSQRELAEIVSTSTGVPVDQTTVSTWFKGTSPKPWYLKALAELYDVSLVWLAFDIGAQAAYGHHNIPEETESDLIPRGQVKHKKRA